MTTRAEAERFLFGDPIEPPVCFRSAEDAHQDLAEIEALLLACDPAGFARWTGARNRGWRPYLKACARLGDVAPMQNALLRVLNLEHYARGKLADAVEGEAAKVLAAADAVTAGRQLGLPLRGELGDAIASRRGT